MSGFFIFILFLLNIGTILAVIVLYLRQNRIGKVENDLRRLSTEMEEMMTAYMMEIKEENDQLIGQLDKTQLASENIEVKQTTILKAEEPVQVPKISSTKNIAMKAYNSQALQTHEKKEKDISTTQNDQFKIEDVPNKEQPIISESLQASLNGQAAPEPSLHEQVMALSLQGLSCEEIAKKLKRGKTEIELLLKFQSDK